MVCGSNMQPQSDPPSHKANNDQSMKVSKHENNIEAPVTIAAGQELNNTSDVLL